MTDKNHTINRPKNAFEFASVASARAKQLQRGCVPKVEGSASGVFRSLLFAPGLVLITSWFPPNRRALR